MQWNIRVDMNTIQPRLKTVVAIKKYIALIGLWLFALPALASDWSDSPALADAVASGELPSVERTNTR